VVDSFDRCEPQARCTTGRGITRLPRHWRFDSWRTGPRVKPHSLDIDQRLRGSVNSPQRELNTLSPPVCATTLTGGERCGRQTEEPEYWPPVTRDEKGCLIMCAPITNQDYLKANPGALNVPGVLSMAKCDMEAAPGVKATKPIRSADFVH
jgi:hypothetical protein